MEGRALEIWNALLTSRPSCVLRGIGLILLIVMASPSGVRGAAPCPTHRYILPPCPSLPPRTRAAFPPPKGLSFRAACRPSIHRAPVSTPASPTATFGASTSTWLSLLSTPPEARTFTQS
ncbi:hypothetical protein HYPSUDRAFT_203624 [Hypholoma sublateritium FD-334 SS-4]|uniref:Uncharacterized protein n=1 Tax=Hypholoma sublateritium (strain FD-334 SS-4) TaxID=945553 RepID=A0A0D2L1X2_HYPSF|nr:hypothetical protein HYPSUDRAFT_203624 [Hypholoma sublateritium FD-334 SS-4]